MAGPERVIPAVCEFLEIGYRPEMLAVEESPPELIAVHPLGKSPVITDEGRTIIEMICAVFESHRAGGPVPMPLALGPIVEQFLMNAGKLFG